MVLLNLVLSCYFHFLVYEEANIGGIRTKTTAAKRKYHQKVIIIFFEKINVFGVESYTVF